jgi:hypothetical protein
VPNGGLSPLAPTRLTNRTHKRLRSKRFRPAVALCLGARVDNKIESYCLNPVEGRLGDGTPSLWLGVIPKL